MESLPFRVLLQLFPTLPRQHASASSDDTCTTYCTHDSRRATRGDVAAIFRTPPGLCRFGYFGPRVKCASASDISSARKDPTSQSRVVRRRYSGWLQKIAEALNAHRSWPSDSQVRDGTAPSGAVMLRGREVTSGTRGGLDRRGRLYSLRATASWGSMSCCCCVICCTMRSMR